MNETIEKLMKALLIEKRKTPPKTHDLVYLNELIISVCEKWTWPLSELRFLTRAAVEFRYPGESATLEDAARAIDLLPQIKRKLGEFLATSLWE